MACWSTGSAARSPRNCRCSRATAVSSPPGIRRELDEWRRLRDESRRLIAGAAGALCRRDRGRGAQDPPQQRDRLLHRDRRPTTPASSARSSSTARRWPARSAIRPPSWPSSKPRSPAPPNARWRWNCGSTTISSARSWRGAARSPRRRRHWRRSMSRRRWPSARPRAAGCGPVVEDGAAFEITGGRHPVVEAALAARQRRRLCRQ